MLIPCTRALVFLQVYILPVILRRTERAERLRGPEGGGGGGDGPQGLRNPDEVQPGPQSGEEAREYCNTDDELIRTTQATPLSKSKQNG